MLSMLQNLETAVTGIPKEYHKVIGAAKGVIYLLRNQSYNLAVMLFRSMRFDDCAEDMNKGKHRRRLSTAARPVKSSKS